MNNKIDISIIMPVYNTEKYISEAIESLLLQGLEKFEVIIINDGSTDSSQKIIDKYKNKYSFVRTFYQENQGQGKARNYAIGIAKGEYIYFMDSDDVLVENSLSKALEILKNKNLDAYFFDGKAFFDKGMNYQEGFNYSRSKSHGYFEKGQLLFGSFYNSNELLVSPCLYIVKKSILIQNKIKFPEGIKNEDLYFTIVLFYYLNGVQHDNKVYFKRRVRQGSTMTNSRNEQVFHDKIMVIELLLDFKSKYRFKEVISKGHLKNKIRDLIRSQIIFYKTSLNPQNIANKKLYKKLIWLGINNKLIGIKELLIILFIRNERDFNRVLSFKKVKNNK